MKFSIAVPCYNGLPYLRRALQSLLENGNGIDIEILVQDAGSTDGSIELARELVGDSAVVVEPDEGQEDAINRAWRRSSGDILAWLNADDELAPGALRTAQEVFEEDPGAQWCVGYFRMIDSQGREIRRLHKWYKHFLLRHYSRRLLFVENMIPQMSVFLRRSLWTSVGDLKLGSWAFDYDYWLRLSSVADPRVIRKTLSAFRWHPASKTGRNVEKLFREELEICRTHTDDRRLLALHYCVYLRNRLLYNLARW
jgi:glycosyltransferase involved in cell wall biosynthesis